MHTVVRRNVHPKVWGGPTWIFLRSVAKAMPRPLTEKAREAFVLLFTVCLPELLPCGTCRENMRKHLESLPPDAFHPEEYVESLYQAVEATKAKHQAKPAQEPVASASAGWGLLQIIVIGCLFVFVIALFAVYSDTRAL